MLRELVSEIKEDTKTDTTEGLVQVKGQLAPF